MKISKFINTTDDKIFHSHGFAQVASGHFMGATSAESFTRRRTIDRNRQVIGKYHESQMGSSGPLDRAQASLPVLPPRPVAVQPPRRRSMVLPKRPSNVSESPRQNFNPFS